MAAAGGREARGGSASRAVLCRAVEEEPLSVGRSASRRRGRRRDLNMRSRRGAQRAGPAVSRAPGGGKPTMKPAQSRPGKAPREFGHAVSVRRPPRPPDRRTDFWNRLGFKTVVEILNFLILICLLLCLLQFA